MGPCHRDVQVNRPHARSLPATSSVWDGESWAYRRCLVGAKSKVNTPRGSGYGQDAKMLIRPHTTTFQNPNWPNLRASTGAEGLHHCRLLQGTAALSLCFRSPPLREALGWGINVRQLRRHCGPRQRDGLLQPGRAVQQGGQGERRGEGLRGGAAAEARPPAVAVQPRRAPARRRAGSGGGGELPQSAGGRAGLRVGAQRARHAAVGPAGA